jgi:hypothetical protein
LIIHLDERASMTDAKLSMPSNFSSKRDRSSLP